MSKESRVRMFSSGEKYDKHLNSRGIHSGLVGRAIGIKKDNKQEIIIDTSFNLAGGIRKEELPAIVRHEQIELESDGANPHLEATIGEYQFILERFGRDRLNRYHTNLCNLIGGDNRIRNQALGLVLED